MLAFTKCINAISRCTMLYRNEMLADVGLNGCQSTYILHICQHPGISQDALAQSIYINKSNVTRQLAGLEARGFIMRKTSEADHRVIEAYPTAKAIDALPRVRQAIRAWNDYLTEDMSGADQRVFFAMLEQMTEKAKRHFAAAGKGAES
jgi:MarR family transcriptional regulator for hemolysin